MLKIQTPDQGKSIPLKTGFNSFLYLHIHFLRILSCKIKALDLWMDDLKST